MYKNNVVKLWFFLYFLLILKQDNTTHIHKPITRTFSFQTHTKLCECLYCMYPKLSKEIGKQWAPYKCKREKNYYSTFILSIWLTLIQKKSWNEIERNCWLYRFIIMYAVVSEYCFHYGYLIRGVCSDLYTFFLLKLQIQ